MIEKTTYIAFNGKEFKNKEECIEYEEKCFSCENDLKVYDKDGKILNNKNSELIANYGTYIVCKTKEALTYFNISCKQNYVNTIVYEKNVFPISFVWRNGNGWYKIKDLIVEHQAEIDILSKYLED